MAETTLDVEKQPSSGQPSVNQPASGTYGEGAALTRLQDALPAAQPPAGPTGTPLPPVSGEPVRPTPPQREGRPPSGAALPPGVPSPILAPSDQPNTPVSTPLAQQSAMPQMTPQQDRLRILDLLIESPNVSDQTRQWAQMLRRVLIGS